MVSNSSIRQEELKSTRVTQFPKTSCIHLISTGSERHFKLAVQQTLVKAVVQRPKHQLVWSKSHRLLLPVCCRVVYGENSHQLPDSKITLCADFMAREDSGLPGDTSRLPLFSAWPFNVEIPG